MKKKIKHILNWLDDRGGFSEMLKPLKEHLVPPGTKWAYVWGSATMFCLVVQVFTGIALAFLYQPTTNAAFQSLQYIENQAFLGHFIRGLHNWGASCMIVLLGVHMCRVYLYAAYKYPREMNWISGVLLLALTITMAFTGQLLRWDSNGVWTAVVGAEQMGRIPFIGDQVAHFFLGGGTLGGESLNRYFSMHTFLVPALLFSVLGYHLYLVFRNGISEPPKPGKKVNPATYRKWYSKMLKKKGEPFFPDVIWRDAVFSVGVLIVLLLLAWLVGAPDLAHEADTTFINAHPKPDWYFTWIYAIFALMPFRIESFMIVFIPLVGAILMFSIPFLTKGGERSPLRRPWAITGVIIVILAIGSFWYIGYMAPWSPRFHARTLSVYTTVPKPDKHIKHGIELFNTQGCIYCHKVGDRGGIRGPSLTTVQQRLTKQEMTIRIVNGAENMPAYGATLTHEELSDLLAFLMQDDKMNRKDK